MSRGFEFSMAKLYVSMATRLQQPCRFCGATPAPNGSIYTWEEALGLELCNACSNWEIDHAHPEYIEALERDNASPSGDIGAKDAWLNTMMAEGITQGQCERRAWERARAKGNGKGKAGSRSRSPRRFEGPGE